LARNGRLDMKLNLGCNDRHLQGYVNVDLCPPADQIVDLSVFPWPWADSSVGHIVAHDIIEHIPNRIATMNQIHRVLRPGGRAEIVVPNASKGAGFYQDPTHISPYCMNSFQYFEHNSFAHRRFAKAYGITAAFRIVELSESAYQDVKEIVFKIKAVLEAVK
jgi:predicted SAM-dependent methyltransferase